VLVVLGRLIQGFSEGAELGGVSVYLAEIAPPGRMGVYDSRQSASQQAAVVFAALLGFGLTRWLTGAQMEAWGWRIPLLVGCLIIPLLFALRRSLAETEAFQGAGRRPRTRAIYRSVAGHWRVILVGMMLVTMTTVSFYLITAYTPTYGGSVLGLGAADNLVVTLCVGVSNFCWLPVMGALSDRIGRRPLLFTATGLALATAYPALLWLVSAPSFGRLLVVQLWLSFLYASYNGAMVVFLTEIMPAEVRTSGFSLAYSLATAVFGGFTPAIVHYLIDATGNPAFPGLWLSFAAACGITAALLARRFQDVPLAADTANCGSRPAGPAPG
jgi:MHS family citrate/tricarballylate:H+ symporter-like MFS transporter